MTLTNALHLGGDLFDESTTGTGKENEVLLRVRDIDQLLELLNEMRNITESVDLVGGLGQLDGSDVEFSELIGLVDLNVVEDGEASDDRLNESNSAGLIEAGGESVNATNEEVFVVVGGSSNFILLCGVLIILTKSGSLHASLLELGGGEGSVNIGLVVDSVDVNSFL